MIKDFITAEQARKLREESNNQRIEDFYEKQKLTFEKIKGDIEIACKSDKNQIEETFRFDKPTTAKCYEEVLLYLGYNVSMFIKPVNSFCDCTFKISW